jgi:cell division septation protein DedD
MMNHRIRPGQEFKEEDFFDEFEDREKKFISNFGLIFLLLSIIAGGLGMTWYYYSPKIINAKQILPIVKAERDPIKIKPLDPGGMVVPNMDKTIYDNLSSNSKSQKDERLLPSPEKPLDREKAISGDYLDNISDNIEPSKSVNKTVNITKDIKDYKIDDSKKNPIMAEKEPNIKKSNLDDTSFIISESDIMEGSEKPVTLPKASAPVALPIDKLAQKNNVKVAKIDIEAVKKNKNPANGYRVQLASFKTQKEVSAEWDKIQKHHEQLVKKHKHIIARKEIAGKGTYYRLQLGPISSESDARMLCKKLMSSDQNCFVIKPGQS